MVMLPTGLLDPMGLTPEQQESVKQQALSNAALNFGLQALASSTGVGYKPRVGQILGQAGQAGLQAYQGTFDQTLQNIARQQQIQDLQRKREQQARNELARQRFAKQFAPTTPETALAAPGRVGPTAERAAMIGQTPALDRGALLSAMLDPNMPPDVLERAKIAYEATAPKEVKLPSSYQEYKIAETDPEFSQFLTRRDAAKGTTVSVKMSETLGKRLDTNLANFEKNGYTARNALPTVQAMSALLDEGVRTGFGQETMNKFNQAAQLFNPGYKTKEVAGQEAFIALSNEIILPQVKQLGVSPTDKDLDFVVKGSPSLSKSVDGNKLLLSTLNLKLQRDAFLQEFVVNWENANIDLVEQSPARANTLLRRAVLDLTKTHPLWTEATQRLRQQYSQITGGSAGSLTAGSPFSRK